MAKKGRSFGRISCLLREVRFVGLSPAAQAMVNQAGTKCLNQPIYYQMEDGSKRHLRAWQLPSGEIVRECPQNMLGRDRLVFCCLVYGNDVVVPGSEWTEAEMTEIVRRHTSGLEGEQVIDPGGQL